MNVLRFLLLEDSVLDAELAQAILTEERIFNFTRCLIIHE